MLDKPNRGELNELKVEWWRAVARVEGATLAGRQWRRDVVLAAVVSGDGCPDIRQSAI